MQTPPAVFPLPASNAFLGLALPGRAGAALLVVFTGLLTAWVFFLGYYPSIFHSDAAAHQLLAQAMVDERSLLPRDFAYGNQLILWRNNLFIAPALALGLEGYRAYAAGSMATFAVFFLAAFLCIDSLLQHWRRSLLACWLLFLPLGHTEADFILGQQSHLGIVVLALVIVIQAFRASQGHRRAPVLCALAVFLLVLEAPTRAVMLLLPLAAALWAGGRLGGARSWLGLVVAGALAGYAGNRWLLLSHQVVGIPPLPLAAYDHFLARASELLKGIVDYFIGFYQFAGMSSKPAHLVLYALKTLALALFAGLAVWLGARLARRVMSPPQSHPAAGPIEFVGMTGGLGAALGFFIVCAIEYWLDIRHFLWALVLLKLALLLAALQWLSHRRFERPMLAALCALAILTSTVGSALVVPPYRARLQSELAVHNDGPVFARVAARMKELGIRRIYGEHWATLRTEVLIPGAQASVITLDGDKVQFVSFVTRPSRQCVGGEVLYLLDRGIAPEMRIIEKVLAGGGREVECLRGNWTLFAGPPVWDRAGCL
ncbi:hypothetical protein GCM10027034_10780 [Ramlibacter solisilvae]|uniref:Candidate membrane protein n=1 Tax=Ramlibacter tataouinensis TaxID=94132 RepID=A0A127JX98_9BURK|nr:hypothetical protein [Ramlibacter tataouinensis]AMO24607.1 hypothetical protein UC35_19435 [Ramlibacter tataouinensis]